MESGKRNRKTPGRPFPVIEGTEYKTVDFKDIENLDYYDGKLFWPNEGRLFTAKIMKDLIGEPEMIHDFTDYTFKAVKAPY